MSRIAFFLRYTLILLGVLLLALEPVLGLPAVAGACALVLLLGLCLDQHARLLRCRAYARTLRERSRALQREVNDSLGLIHAELAHLGELAIQVGALSNECDTALQQQQRKLDRALSAFAQIKVEGRQLADDAHQVGSESRQSMKLALKGQAGLSATLMALRSVDQTVLTAPVALGQEVRVLARQGRDQTYDANLALAGISAAASNIEERGLSIAVACEAQARGVQELDEALAEVQRLGFTSGWRSRQARAASEALLQEAARLDERLRVAPWTQDLQQDAGGMDAAVQDPDRALSRLDQIPGPGAKPH
ncbi:hypothetical protein [Pseudomonas putida]|uniref:Chemotaxis protein n=1 Tax=Pseudomonas putida TaxID=303 RepID=A0A1Q9RAB9_PSEPU|nr:hypothetical protein [Pseudomonas putida]OLS64317.1 hypothetical protein PSEMO_08620 [Pseudomonas putida]